MFRSSFDRTNKREGDSELSFARTPSEIVSSPWRKTTSVRYANTREFKSVHFVNKKQDTLEDILLSVGGEKEIRTLDTLSTYTRFPVAQGWKWGLDKRKMVWYDDNGRKTPGDTINGGGFFLKIHLLRESIIFSPSSEEGGDVMDYVTWQDLLQIALLIITVISCFRNKKR